MTNQQHPITVTPELVQQWFADWESSDNEEVSFAEFAIPRAAQWGADQELEACAQWVDWHWSGVKSRELRATRRPKPPSLKEQALDAYNRMMAGTETQDDWTIIRRALEQLND